MQTVKSVADFLYPLWIIIGPPLVSYVAYLAVAEMQRRGYSTTYVSALTRAVGAGFNEAKEKGLDPFSPAGRAAVAIGGANYLKSQVGVIAGKLSITEAMHQTKVLAEMDSMELQAATTAKAGQLEVASSVDSIRQAVVRSQDSLL